MNRAAPDLSMSPALSLYLDVVRFAAAVGVFLNHLRFRPFTDGPLPEFLGAYGAICVIVFFVLSGYVIAAAVASKETTAAVYVTNRLSRLYSVVLPALLLTFVFDTVGQALNPALYLVPKVMWEPASAAGYLSSLFFVNEYRGLGIGGLVPGSNGPFWSLSFEATYYVVAGLVLFARPMIALPIAIAVLACAGPTVAALLPLWALGFALFHVQPLRVRWWVSAFAFVGTAVALLALPKLAGRMPLDLGFPFLWGRGDFPRNLLGDYLAAGVFGVHLLAARNLCAPLQVRQSRLRGVVRYLGALTFPLYCLHFPALAFFRAFDLWPAGSWANTLWLVAGVFAVTMAVTHLAERWKHSMRRLASVAIGVARARPA